MKKNILITGKPRSGKSTLLRKLIVGVSNKVGFITNEIREEGERVGFEIETSGGSKALLAHVDFKTEHQVSKYFVDVKNLEVLISEASRFKGEDLLYLDEIGQMQLFSEEFKKLALSYLNSQNRCIATVSCIYEDDFIKRIKAREDVTLIEITAENREEKEILIAHYL